MSQQGMVGKFRIVLCLGALCCAALAGCATTLAPDDAVASGPFEIDDRGRFIVRLSVNGSSPQPFIVDTAASISGIYAPFVESLGLSAGHGSVTVHGLIASGRLPLVLISELEFDQAQWINRSVVQLPALLADESIADSPVGILGIDMLQQYGVQFSIASRTLRFYSPQTMSRRRYEGWASVPLRQGDEGAPSGSVYFIDVEIREQPVRAVFDLGSGVNMVNWRAARRVGMIRGKSQRVRSASVGGVHEETGLVSRFIASQINTGEVSWRDEIFGVEDLGIFATLGLADRSAALLGAGLFAQRDFVIDFAQRRILIRRADETPMRRAPATQPDADSQSLPSTTRNVSLLPRPLRRTPL